MLTGKNKYYIRLIILSFLCLFIFSYSAKTAELSKPIFDFSESYNSEDSYTSLDGGWMFFHEELLSYEEAVERFNKEEGPIFQLPSSFELQTKKKNTYGTYVAKLKVPSDCNNEILAIHIPYQYSAYSLFINEQRIAKNGRVGENKSSHLSEMAPKIGYFRACEEELFLIFQVSSFEHIRGGFENSIYFGNGDLVTKKFNIELILSLFINGSIFVIGLFLVLISLHQKEKVAYLIFGSFCLTISFRALFSVPFYYTLLFPSIGWVWGTRLEYILTGASTALFIAFIWFIHKDVFSKMIMKVIVSIPIPVMVVTLFTRPVFFQDLFFKVFYTSIPASIYMAYVIIKSIRQDNEYAKINLIGIILILIAFFNDFALGQNLLQSRELMLFAVAIYVLIHVIMLSRGFADQSKNQEILNEELRKLNRSLDNRVKERTVKLEETNLHLKKLASKDGLTGIYNRMYFNQHIEEFLDRARGEEKPLTLLLMDIDQFKNYNDYYGHVKGDELLKEITKIISQSIPEDGFFARYGGEEFAILLENTKSEEGYKIAENIRRSVEARNIEHVSSTFTHVTLSIGVETIEKPGANYSATDLINAADKKLYQAKAKGRNQVI